MKGHVRLGERLSIKVSNLATLLAESEAKGKPITLFVNEVDTGLAATDIDRVNEKLVFRLLRTTDEEPTKALWSRLFREPFSQPQTSIHVTVGLHEGSSLDFASTTGRLILDKVRVTGWGWFWIVILVLTVATFLVLVGRTDILRNGPRLNSADPKTVQPFSLGRSQMAWWFFLVIVSYVLIWLITGDRDTVPGSALILMGIAAATAFGAIAIDSTASARIEAALKQLDDEKAALTSRSASAGISQDLKAAVDQRIGDINRAQVNVVQANRSKSSWLQDVLTDDIGGVALHRFQVLMWTFVLGGVFIGSIMHALSMPDFSPTLLALMGISSTTYLGFKFPVST
ncbi:MAG TPA: hypothetical protein VGS22_05580 [Thermoanaerobaculia bacterium]|nr:hypothetical protein [Thermoanaerobaculia bacterium]